MLGVAGKTASYREWKAEDPCKGDPKVLKRDFDSMNALMAEFLTQTGMGVEGAWTEEQIALLDSGQTELPPGVDALSKAVALLKKCKPDPAIAKGVKAADDNIRDVRQRLLDGPSIIPVLRAKIVLAKWKAEQAEALKTNKDQWCGGTVKPGTVPDIFYASEDETGKTEFHFCNDVKVITEGSGKPQLVDPDNKVKKKEHQKYLEVAAKYPASEVQKAPKVAAGAATASSDAKPAEAKPEEAAKKEEPKAEEKPAEAKKEEPKPAETKKEEPKAEEKPAEKNEKKKEEAKANTPGKKGESGDLKPDD
jgi:hypothetical protein